MTHYTLVRHTGYSQAGYADFRQAVEERGITEREAEKVRKAGGLVFTGYENASTAEMAENYPPGSMGLIPTARGTFVSGVLNEELYIPATVAPAVHSCEVTDRTLDVLERALRVVIDGPDVETADFSDEAQRVLGVVKGWRS